MRLLFSSFHNYLDGSNGASITSKEELHYLCKRGHKVSTFCGGGFDSTRHSEDAEKLFLDILRIKGVVATCKTFPIVCSGVKYNGRVYLYNDDGIEASTIFLSTDDNHPLSLRDVYSNKHFGTIFLKTLKAQIDAFHPDVFMSYGGYWFANASGVIAKNAGSHTVFRLHNLNYKSKDVFKPYDDVTTPSAFAQKYYQTNLKIDSVVTHPLIDSRRTLVKHNSKKYLTFVNPSPEKGLYFFVGLAAELELLRPDIQFLLVENRGKIDSLKSIPIARRLKNLHVLQQVDSPSGFLCETRVLIHPSLCEESFGRVAVEAGMNMIPVLASDRGALPEVVGIPELILHIPERFSPLTKTIPVISEVKPWIESIVRLWDSESLCDLLGRRICEHVKKYSTNQVGCELETLFSSFAKRK